MAMRQLELRKTAVFPKSSLPFPNQMIQLHNKYIFRSKSKSRHTVEGSDGEDVMPEDRGGQPMQPPRSFEQKRKKKKKRKKVSESGGPLQNTEKSLLPPCPKTLLGSPLPSECSYQPKVLLPKLRALSPKDGSKHSGGRRKKHSNKSETLLTPRNGTSRCCGQVLVVDSLRWEGVLEDPRAEEERLDVYRANRRKRYVSHREALLREIHVD